jgi:cellulose synthase/poly-beta-1,6-N-acetylglucosamine synthase-like glycosyltransferase
VCLEARLAGSRDPSRESPLAFVIRKNSSLAQTGLTNDSKAIVAHGPLRVSVIIPSYLRPETLLKCVESILAGSHRPTEIVIVGRAGDTGTEKAISAIEAAPHEAVKIRSAWVTEAGHVPPVETGARTASSDLVAIVDDDVTVTPEWLSSLVPHFGDPGVGVVCGRVSVPGTPLPKLKGRPGCVSWYGRNWGNLGSVGGEAAFQVDSVMEGNSIWRRDLLASLEFDPVLNFDDASMYGLDLCLQVKGRGLKLIYEPRALVYHHVAPRAPELDRQKRGPRSFSFCRNYTYIILKRFPAWRRLVFLVWWFLVGERGSWGLGSLLVDMLQGGWQKERYVAYAWRGKIEGARLWRRQPSRP